MAIKTILVVDDELEYVNEMAKGLEILGYKVLKAANVTSAKEIFDRTKPDVVLSDYKLDDANGTDVTQYAKAKYPSTYCILLTGYFDESLKEAMKQLGVDQVIYKPVDLNELEAILEKLSSNT